MLQNLNIPYIDLKNKQEKKYMKKFKEEEVREKILT